MQTEAQKRDCERKRKSYPAHKAERIARATKWNSEHPEARAEGNKRHHNARTEFGRAQKLGKVCAHCGEADIDKLHFHHVDPTTKLFEIGPSYRSDADILAEIAKCILLCRSCHTRYHNLHKQV